MASASFRKIVVIAVALSVIGGSVAISAPRTVRVQIELDVALLRLLEQRFSRAAVTDWSGIAGLVVAGGSVDRTLEAIRLAQHHQHLRIVLSGPSDMEVALVTGVGDLDGRVAIDCRPQSTYENALMSKALLAPTSEQRWLLVTSASHMPRAMGAFHAVGFQIEPWPVNDGDPQKASRVAMHEWLGLLAYWLQGRSNALLPGQASATGASMRD